MIRELNNGEILILDSCPFCGSDRIEGFTYPKNDRMFKEYVSCEQCGASTTTYKTRQEAIDAWNRRYTDDDLR